MNLSLIVPAYNAGKTISNCLNPLIEQMRDGDELIVINDCSDDSTELILAEFSKNCQALRVVNLESNQGQGFCRNHGASLAGPSSEVLVFIDSDIELTSGSLNIIRSAFSQRGLSALTGIISLEHPYKGFFSNYKNIYMNTVFKSLPSDINFLYGGICAIRAQDFLPWPVEDLLGEDTHLGLELVAAGKTLLLEKNLEAIHHKQYNLLSIVKNDFMIPFGFAKSFYFFIREVLRGRMRKHTVQFSHVSPKQILCLFLSFFGSLSILFFELRAIPIFVFFFTLVSLLNKNLIFQLWKTKGLLFTLLGLFWNFFDHVIMTCGAFCGLIYHGKILVSISKKPAKDRLERL